MPTEGDPTGVFCAGCKEPVSEERLVQIAGGIGSDFTGEQVRSAVLYGLVEIRCRKCVEAVIGETCDECGSGGDLEDGTGPQSGKRVHEECVV